MRQAVPSSTNRLQNVAIFNSETNLNSIFVKKRIRNFEMEKTTKYLDLKPFSNEVDETRQYDLIRGLVLFMAVREHPNKGKTAIAGRFYYFKALYNDICMNNFPKIFFYHIYDKSFRAYQEGPTT